MVSSTIVNGGDIIYKSHQKLQIKHISKFFHLLLKHPSLRYMQSELINLLSQHILDVVSEIYDIPNSISFYFAHQYN